MYAGLEIATIITIAATPIASYIRNSVDSYSYSAGHQCIYVRHRYSYVFIFRIVSMIYSYRN